MEQSPRRMYKVEYTPRGLVRNPADIVGRIALIRVRLGEIMLGGVSLDEVELYF